MKMMDSVVKECCEEGRGVQVGWFVGCRSCRSFSMKARLRQSHGGKRALEVRSQKHRRQPPSTIHLPPNTVNTKPQSCRNHGRDGKQFPAVQQHLGLFTVGPAAPSGPSHHLRLHNAPLYAQPARPNRWCNHRSAKWPHNHHGASLPVQDQGNGR
jgi:hypothetical protein